MNEKELQELGNKIVDLQNEAVLQTLLIWQPEAERIIDTNSKDINAIEHTLYHFWCKSPQIKNRDFLFIQKRKLKHSLSYGLILFWNISEKEQILVCSFTSEMVLDTLCEVAFDNKALVLFKKLCRYYYDIDPQATAEQIQFYREMWDNNDEKEYNF